jgi:hypothetical protein
MRLRLLEYIFSISQTGCSKWFPARPQEARSLRRRSRYVEGDSRLRTPLEDIFSIIQNRLLKMAFSKTARSQDAGGVRFGTLRRTDD